MEDQNKTKQKQNMSISKFPVPVEAQAIVVKQTTPTQIENIEIQNLGDTVDQVSESIEILETELHDAGVGTDLLQKDVGVKTDDTIAAKSA